MDKEYYYIDFNKESRKIVEWGTSKTANFTGETYKVDVFRIFLTKGQYNKFLKNLES